MAKEKKEKELTPFTILYDLSKQKLYSEDDVKASGLSIFLLLNFLKSSRSLIHIASYLNQNHKMKLYNMYVFVFMTFRMYDVRYCKWIKDQKVHSSEDTELVMDFYKVKRRIADQYLDKMSKEELDYIRLVYS